jgi:hypothetical protein
LFNVVESLGNYIFEQETLPTVFGAKVISYDLGAYKVFIENYVVETSKSAYSVGNSKG